MNEKLSQFKKDFLQITQKANAILVTSHMSPDDDSIGSVLGMGEYLRTLYKDTHVTMAYSGTKGPELSHRYGTFKGFEDISFVPDVTELFSSHDVVIVLDGGSYNRFTPSPESFSLARNIICIDHHASPADTFTLSYIEPTHTSASEIVYMLCYGEGGLTQSSAEALLLGVLGDTGNFRFIRPHQTEVFSIARKLVESAGVSIDELQSRYGQMSDKAFALVQELLKNTFFSQVEGWPAFQYAYIDENLFDLSSYTDDQIGAARHIYIAMYVRNVVGYNWGFVITPHTSAYKMSLRSIPKSVNVRDFMERMNLGGGHDRASGGTFQKDAGYDSVKTCVSKLKEWMAENPPLLS